MRNYRRTLLSLALAVTVPAILQAQGLQPCIDGTLLRVAAPQLHFLSGRILEKLHNGATVPFVLQLSASTSGKTAFETGARYVLSYDLWEERFSVLQTGNGNRSASHLSSAAAEAWCLENLTLPVSALAAEKTFVLKLEIRVEESREEPADPRPGLSMAGLIDVFSRKAKEEPLRWSAVSRPFGLNDLSQKSPNQKSPTRKQ